MDDPAFVIDPRLDESGLPLGDFALSRVFLVDDARFPWLMLVPRRSRLVEIHDLSSEDQHLLFDETMRAAEALGAVSKPDKLNIGALGNVVRQLHVHVVGRFASDSAWPGPVWGFGQRQPYPAHMAGPLMDRLRARLWP